MGQIEGIRMSDTGAFSAEFTKKKKWKLDKGLCDALDLALGVNGEYSGLIDIGAGVGQYVEWFRSRGCDALGFDATPNINDISEGRVVELDVAENRAWKKMRKHVGFQMDSAICIEVGEHIPEPYLNDFLNNVTRVLPAYDQEAKTRLVISWATPGQRGRDHVSCRPPEWVACELGKRGFDLQWELTEAARKIAGKGWDRKLLVFDRERKKR